MKSQRHSLKIALRKLSELPEDRVGVPEFNSMQMGCGCNQPVRRVFVLPFPESRLARHRFGDRQNFKSLQRQVEPTCRIGARQSARAPFADDFHTGDRAKITDVPRVFQGGFNLPRQWQSANKSKPDTSVHQDSHFQMSSRTGSSRLMPRYSFGLSGFSTRHGLPRPGIGVNLADGRPCRRMITVSPASTRSTSSQSCFFALAMGVCMTTIMTISAERSTQVLELVRPPNKLARLKAEPEIHLGGGTATRESSRKIPLAPFLCLRRREFVAVREIRVSRP